MAVLNNVVGLYFVYDFHPLSDTLEARHFNQGGGILPEAVLWSYISQLCSALKAIHNSGLACRVVDASKILITGKNRCVHRSLWIVAMLTLRVCRIRIGSVGIFDVISFEADKDVSHFQREDLLSMGKLILSLACKSPTAVNNMSESLEYIGTQYSPDLKNFVVRIYTLSSTGCANPHITRFPC